MSASIGDPLAAALIAGLDDQALDALAERLAPRLAGRLAEASEEDRWLDSSQAVAYLGLRSVHALHKLTSARVIPFSQDRPNARCYFKRSDLDAWRAQARRGPRR